MRALRLFGVVAVVMLSMGLAGTAQAKEDRVLKYTVMQPGADYFRTGIVKDGPCEIGNLTTPFRGVPSSQLAVRNEDGTILSVVNLENGTVVEMGTGLKSIVCVTKGELKLPSAAFYDVSLDGIEVRILQPNDFPMEGTDGLVIELPDARQVLKP